MNIHRGYATLPTRLLDKMYQHPPSESFFPRFFERRMPCKPCLTIDYKYPQSHPL